jgi:hypothetical protein
MNYLKVSTQAKEVALGAKNLNHEEKASGRFTWGESLCAWGENGSWEVKIASGSFAWGETA